MHNLHLTFITNTQQPTANNQLPPKNQQQEMEFVSDNFQSRFCAKTRAFSDSNFCLVFYPHNSVLQNATYS
jgi:hypothetical protein